MTMKNRVHNHIKTFSGVLVLAVLLLALSCQALAFQYTPLDVTIPVIVNEEMDIVVQRKDHTSEQQDMHVLKDGTLLLTYTEPGTYEYIAWQKVGTKEKGKIYDTALRHILVAVSDEDSSLFATVVITKMDTNTKPGNLEFINTSALPPEDSTTPEDDPGTIPPDGTGPGTSDANGARTGDMSLLLPLLFAGTASLAAIVAAIILKGRKRNME